MADFVTVTYGQTGASQTTNAYGMRAMQERAFDARNSQYLLVKAPPASGNVDAIGAEALQRVGSEIVPSSSPPKEDKVVPLRADRPHAVPEKTPANARESLRAARGRSDVANFRRPAAEIKLSLDDGEDPADPPALSS